MVDPYAPLLAAVRRAVFDAPAQTSIEQRRAAASRETSEPVLAAYLDRVHDAAAEITDDDFTALRCAGYDEEALFELTVAAAVGAAVSRCERALAALEASEP